MRDDYSMLNRSGFEEAISDAAVSGSAAGKRVVTMVDTRTFATLIPPRTGHKIVVVLRHLQTT